MRALRFLFRFFSIVALAAATIMAVLDATRSVAAKQLVLTSLSTSWARSFPDSLAAFRTSVEQISAFLWDPVATTILGLPGFLLFGLLALLLHVLGQRRAKRIGRLVIDS